MNWKGVVKTWKSTALLKWVWIPRNLPSILKVKIRYDEYRAQVRRSLWRRRRSAASICVMLLLERAFSVIIAEKTWVFCLKKPGTKLVWRFRKKDKEWWAFHCPDKKKPDEKTATFFIGCEQHNLITNKIRVISCKSELQHKVNWKKKFQMVCQLAVEWSSLIF